MEQVTVMPREYKVEIENVRGCSSASFTLKTIVLLMGPNGASKTSIIRPCGMVLTGMVPKVKAARQRMLKDGSSRGRIQIGGSSIELPNDDSITTGGTPKASRFAAGLVNFADEKPDLISTFLQKLLKTEPTEEQLREELTKQKVKADMQDAVWEVVTRKGYDDAGKFYVERGRDLKSQWHGVTGLTWGVKQSAVWTPGEWEPELDGKSEQTLNDELAQQRETLEGMIAYEAVTSEKLSELQELYMGLEPAKEAAELAKVAYAEQEAAFRNLTDELKEIGDPALAPKTYDCTACGVSHILVSGVLKQAPPQPSLADVSAHIKRRDAKQDQINIAGPLLQAAQSAVRRTELDVSNAQTAFKRYQELMARPKVEQPDPKLIEKQRTQVDRCQKRLEAFKLKRNADTKHQAVMDNQLLIDTLAPDGFRQRHSAEAIAKFNADFLADQSKVAGYPLVKLDKNMDITLGGRLYEDLSGGEKYRVNAIFQVALARIQGDDILLFDGADILDSNGRRGLFTLLKSVGIPAIVGMTARYDQAPDLTAMGIGESYWLDGGVLSPLKVATPA